MDSPLIHDRGRGPELIGTRTTVYDVIPYRLAKHDPDWVAGVMGHTREQIDALYRYMDDHYDEVMAVHWKIEARNARGNPEAETRRANMTNPKVLAMRSKVAEWRRKQAEADGDGYPG